MVEERGDPVADEVQRGHKARSVDEEQVGDELLLTEPVARIARCDERRGEIVLRVLTASGYQLDEVGTGLQCRRVGAGEVSVAISGLEQCQVARSILEELAVFGRDTDEF